MKRNRNVDIIRAVAILIIVVYHIYALGGYPYANHVRLNYLLSFGGELGVTLFLLLSGYGIYCSLARSEQKGKHLKWTEFMKRRCMRIMPPYYICLVVLIVFQSYSMISVEGVPTIIAYVCFGQNLFVRTHGAINGALWTLGTIFQFYLIAPLLYKAIKKNWVVTTIISVIITIFSKFIIYHFALTGQDSVILFVYGRQLVSALDNFVLGMIAAMIAEKVLDKRKQYTTYGVVGVIILIPVIVGLCYFLSKKGIFTDSITGYVGHSILAFVLMLLIFFASVAKQARSKTTGIFDWIAANQYGIYLWHMPLIAILGNGAPAVTYLRGNHFAVYMIVMLIVSVIFGGYYSKGVDLIIKNRR